MADHAKDPVPGAGKFPGAKVPGPRGPIGPGLTKAPAHRSRNPAAIETSGAYAPTLIGDDAPPIPTPGSIGHDSTLAQTEGRPLPGPNGAAAPSNSVGETLDNASPVGVTSDSIRPQIMVGGLLALPDLVGKTIENRYEVLEELSRGGMGAVYRARHIHLDTAVALKVLLRPQNEVYQALFMREARLASKVHHPNLVFISDFGLLPDGRSYLVMELLRGRPLSQEISAGRLDPLRACRIAQQIATGLQAVHQAGIVHRGLKRDFSPAENRAFC